MTNSELLDIGKWVTENELGGFQVDDGASVRPVTNVEMEAYAFYQLHGLDPIADRWLVALSDWIAQGCPASNQG